MSKKNRKKFRKFAATEIKNPVMVSATAQRSSEFNPDYSYVIKDLKRIGALAGFFLAVLIGLAFILR